MQIIGDDFLDKISNEAIQNERLRMNYNFHDSLDSPAQRLLNALEPNTNIPIHRHKETSETYLLLRGKLKIMFYNDKGKLIDSSVLDSNKGKYGVHIPKGTWHSLQVFDSKTVIFEVKDGPYKPLSKEDLL